MSSREDNNNGRRNIGEGNRREMNRSGNGGSRPMGNNGSRPINNGKRQVGNNGRRPVGNNSYSNNGKYGSPNSKQHMEGQNRQYGNRQYVGGEAGNYNSGNQGMQGMNNGYPNYGQGNNMNSVPGGEQYNDIVGLNESYNEDGTNGETNLEADAALKKQITVEKVKKGLKIFSIAMLSIVLVVGIFIYVKYGREVMKIRKEAMDLMEGVDEKTFMKSSKSQYFAKKSGKWVSVSSSTSNNEYISMSEGKENMALARDLMVTSEDKGFYKHKGVDFWATFKAIILAIMKGRAERGGSTITQQLSRNVILNDFDQNWQRKVREMFVSWEIEKRFNGDKDKIMEFYLNNINFANDYIGIENAAKGYFGKSVSQLSKGQVAFLCSIPNSPAMYNPRKHIDATNERKNRLLKQLYDDSNKNKNVQGISKSDYDAATKEVISKVNDAVEVKTTKANKNVQKIDYMLQIYLKQCAIEYLMKSMGYSTDDETTQSSSKYLQQKKASEYEEVKSELETRLQKQGYCIYTSIDLDVQNQLQNSIDTKVSQFTMGKEKKKTKGEEEVYALQSAGVCIDNATGYVVAAVSGRTGGVTNYEPRATGIVPKTGTYSSAYAKQPGSAIKPLLVYGPAFDYKDEQGRSCYDEKTPVEDNGPLPVAGRKPVKNSGDHYMGNISIMDAIKGSSNVVAYKLYRELLNKQDSGNIVTNYLGKMGFKALTTDDQTSEACSIGGFSNGATPLEMASAYATIENDGEYRSPTAVITVKQISGDPTKFDESKENTVTGRESKRVYQKETARKLIKCMKEVMEPSRNGLKYSGTAANSKLSIDCAGKTGTTNENKNNWFCGFNSYYSTAIWVGRDDQKATKINGQYVATVWKDFNEKVIGLKGLINKELDTFIVDPQDSSGLEIEATTEHFEMSEEPSEEPEDEETLEPSSIDIPSPTWNNDRNTPTPYLPPSQEPVATDNSSNDDEDPAENPNNGNNNNNNNGNHGGNNGDDMNEFPGN